MQEIKIENKEMLIINQDSGYLMIDIANSLADKGYTVTLLTGRLVIRNNKLKEKVSICKIIEYNRKTNFNRIFTWTIAFFQILFLIKSRFRRHTLILVSNPPFTTFLPLFVRNSFSMLIFDVFPDAISEMGMMRKDSLIIKTWEKANRKVYKKAEKVYTITEGMRTVIQKYTHDHKVHVINLWSDGSFLKPIPSEYNPFIIRHKLQGKFLVMYSGSIGFSQNLLSIIEVAKENLLKTGLFFVFIGDGSTRNKIEDEIRKNNLLNCLLLPWQNPEEIPYSFAASNLAVVCNGSLSASVAIPSKLYDFFSVGSPILGLAPRDSELDVMISQLNVGKCFDPYDIENMSKYIRWLSENPDLYNELHANSLSAAKRFTSDNAKKIEPFLCPGPLDP